MLATPKAMPKAMPAIPDDVSELEIVTQPAPASTTPRGAEEMEEPDKEPDCGSPVASFIEVLPTNSISSPPIVNDVEVGVVKHRSRGGASSSCSWQAPRIPSLA